ncbi:cell migration-inducing and hyaluronan-binding protein-like [Triplophysa rosa]|uniref:cell migration-inducing and hyaluronan-binding protein-like n=1 Tax=Triplophysa rosa TaxID=992332 RepID=UPI002545F4AB|nr:cell migration-inducing and hyaluronan-binding protein-like [Triplophysa rosa]
MIIKVFAACVVLVSGLLGVTCLKCTTHWFDRDDPSGKGDYENLSDLLKEYPGLICPNPTGIEVQTVSGQPASQTGDIFQVNDATGGFACVNADQNGKQCADYRVRFTCPEMFCSVCRTSWLDRDDPSGRGDDETLSDIHVTYPGKVCSQPIAIEVTTISGTPALQTGNIFHVYDPLQGFACVNEQQTGSSCQDYMVRFTCPQIFCK